MPSHRPSMLRSYRQAAAATRSALEAPTYTERMKAIKELAFLDNLVGAVTGRNARDEKLTRSIDRQLDIYVKITEDLWDTMDAAVRAYAVASEIALRAGKVIERYTLEGADLWNNWPAFRAFIKKEVIPAAQSLFPPQSELDARLANLNLVMEHLRNQIYETRQWKPEDRRGGREFINAASETRFRRRRA